MDAESAFRKYWGVEKDANLEVKTILVAEDGSWTAKQEAPPAERRTKTKAKAGSVMANSQCLQLPLLLTRARPAASVVARARTDVIASANASAARTPA